MSEENKIRASYVMHKIEDVLVKFNINLTERKIVNEVFSKRTLMLDLNFEPKPEEKCKYCHFNMPHVSCKTNQDYITFATGIWFDKIIDCKKFESINFKRVP